jgi:hypothetical protein
MFLFVGRGGVTESMHNLSLNSKPVFGPPGELEVGAPYRHLGYWQKQVRQNYEIVIYIAVTKSGILEPTHHCPECREGCEASRAAGQ